MGVRRIFSSGGHQGIFPKISQEGQKWLNLFFPLKTKKTTIFAKVFKIQGGPWTPLPPLPTPMAVKCLLPNLTQYSSFLQKQLHSALLFSFMFR